MTKQSEDIDIEAIKKLAEDCRSGWLAGDADALFSLYADDPVLMPSGQPAENNIRAEPHFFKKLNSAPPPMNSAIIAGSK